MLDNQTLRIGCIDLTYVVLRLRRCRLKATTLLAQSWLELFFWNSEFLLRSGHRKGVRRRPLGLLSSSRDLQELFCAWQDMNVINNVSV